MIHQQQQKYIIIIIIIITKRLLKEYNEVTNSGARVLFHFWDPFTN